MAKNIWLTLSIVAIIITTIVLVYHKQNAYNPSQIVGTWQGDTSAALNEMYAKKRISAFNALSVVTFNANGTYASEDSATFQLNYIPIKTAGICYHGTSGGKFSYNGFERAVHEVDGERTMNGMPIPVNLPDSVSLELRDESSLYVVEDYGLHGQMKYILYRMRNNQ